MYLQDVKLKVLAPVRSINFKKKCLFLPIDQAIENNFQLCSVLYMIYFISVKKNKNACYIYIYRTNH